MSEPTKIPEPNVLPATARFKNMLSTALERVCVLEEIVERERTISAALEAEVERLTAENAALAEKAKKLERRLARKQTPRA